MLLTIARMRAALSSTTPALHRMPTLRARAPRGDGTELRSLGELGDLDTLELPDTPAALGPRLHQAPDLGHKL